MKFACVQVRINEKKGAMKVRNNAILPKSLAPRRRTPAAGVVKCFVSIVSLLLQDLALMSLVGEFEGGKWNVLTCLSFLDCRFLEGCRLCNLV